MSKQTQLFFALLLFAAPAFGQLPSATANSKVKLTEGNNTWFAPVWSILASLKADSTWAIAPGGGYAGKRIGDNVYRTGKVSIGTTDTTAMINVSAPPDVERPAIQISGNSDILLSVPADTRGDSISDFAIMRGFFPDASEVGDNQVVLYGLNTTPAGGRKDTSKPGISFRIEEKYDVTANGITTPHYEYHDPQVDFENGGASARPVTGYFGHRRSYGGHLSYEVDYLSIRDFKTGVQKATWGFGTNTPYIKGIDFADTATLRFGLNNFPIFSQRNAANTGYVAALKVDNLDRVLLGGSGESNVAAYNSLQITNSGLIFNENGTIQVGKTGTPNALEIFGGASGEYATFKNTSDGREWVLGVSGNDLYMRSYTGGDYPWWVDKRGPTYTWRSTQTGDIGLGLYSPAAKLDILTSGGASTPLFRMRNSGGYSTFYRTTALPEGSLTADPGDIALSAISGTGRMWLKESGSGNTGWKEFLTPSNGITGSGSANQITYWSGSQGLTGSSNGTYNGTDFYLNRTYTNTRDMNLVLNGNVPGINFRASTTASFSLFSGYYDANTLSLFHGAGTGNPSTNIANFKSDGTVGIGTNSTSAMLHVAGTGRFDGNLTARGTGTAPTLYLNNTTASTGKEWYINSVNAGSLVIGNPTTADAISINGTTGATTIANTLTVSTATGTATTVTGRTSGGVITDVTIGSGLSLSGGTLSASGGGGPSVETLSQWTADQDNVSISSGTTTLRVSGDNGIRALTSLNASGMTSGREFNILNVGTQPVVLQAQHPDGTSGNKFDIGQDVVLAPKGSCRAIYDGTSTAFRVISDGAKTQRKFGRAIVAGSATASDWQDLQFQFDGGGTMTAFAPTSTLPAALSATTGASSSSDAYVIASKGVNGLFTHGLGYSYFRTVVTIPTLSDGTQGFYTLHGWYNAGSNPPNTSFANTVVIAYSHSDNSGKWVGYSADNGGSVSTVDLGVTVAANTPYTLEIYTNKQNTESRFFVDGVYKGRVTANRPTAGTVMMPISGISKTIGSTSRSVYVHEIEHWGIMSN